MRVWRVFLIFNRTVFRFLLITSSSFEYRKQPIDKQRIRHQSEQNKIPTFIFVLACKQLFFLLFLLPSIFEFLSFVWSENKFKPT